MARRAANPAGRAATAQVGGASRCLWALLSRAAAQSGAAPLPGTSAPRRRFRKGRAGGRTDCAGRKWAFPVQVEPRCRRDLAELEGAGERSSGGPRGPSDRVAGGPAAATAAPAERGGDGAPSRAGAGAGASAMFAGLQDLGVANGEDLKETLTNCTEPLKAIEQFQVLWSAESGSGAGSRGKWADFSSFKRCVCSPG